jgi:hypothetical protein
MELAWAAFAEVVFPIMAGVLLIALSPRWLSVGSHPFVTAFVLYVLLLVLTALAAPGYDMWVPFIGGLVSLAAAIAVFIVLRRRRLAATRDTGVAG